MSNIERPNSHSLISGDEAFVVAKNLRIWTKASAVLDLAMSESLYTYDFP